MSKQDRHGARTPADLERKYEFGQTLSELQETSRKQSDQISRQNDTMTEFIARSDKENAVLEKGLSDVEKSVSSLYKNIYRLQIRMTNAESRDVDVSQSITGLAKRISSSEQSSSGQNNRLTNLENAVSELFTRLATAEETLADLVERVTALEST